MSNDFGLQNQSEFPLVSICIPAYNSEATLGATLNSVLSQDYPCLDIVVSDNQSTDHTKEIVQRYAEHGVRYCLHPEGRPAWAVAMPNYIGGYANWNYVLSQGHGDYLCLFHSDDLYEPSIVRRQVAVMQANPQVGAVFTQLRYIGEDSRPIHMGMSKLPDGLNEEQPLDFATLLNLVLTHSNFLPTPSVMLRRSVLDKVGGFDERNFLTSADLEMWLRIAYQGNKIAIIDEPLLKYRISHKQFGAQYNKLRTTPTDIFTVLDYFLAQSEVHRIVKSDAMAFYEVDRAVDNVLCAMNLLVQNNIADAKQRLTSALCPQNFVSAARRPRRFAQLVVGVGLLACISVGLGVVAGKGLYKIHQNIIQQRQRPIANEWINQ